MSKISDSLKEIEVKLSFDEIKDRLNQEVKKRTQNLQIDGFRKGKVPQHIIKKMFGDALEYEASEKVAKNYFWDLVEKENIQVLDIPILKDLDFKLGEKLNFKIQFQTYPDIDVKDYTNIEIEIPEYKVTDEVVEQEIKYILEKQRQMNDVEEMDDQKNYVIDVEVIRTDENGNVLENSKPENITIDLSNESVHPDIINNAKSKKVGDEFTFHFEEKPKEKISEEDSAEKESYYYKMKILGIKKIIIPELTDEFVRKYTGQDNSNVEDFKNEIKEGIKDYYDDNNERLFETKLIAEIVKRNDFTPPKSLVDRLLEDYLKEEESYYKKYRIHFSKEKVLDRLQKKAEKNVKWYLIRDEIIKKENITLTDDDISRYAKEESELTNTPFEKVFDSFQSPEMRDSLLYRKFYEFLKEKNIMKFVEPNKLSEEEAVNEE